MPSLNDQLVTRAQLWAVTIEQTFETNSALLAFGTRDQSPVVLKISKQRGDEWHSGETLRAFAGEGMVRVYESEPGAVLIEWLVPGNDLVNVVRQGDDEGATGILAEVMQRLAGHAPPPNCPTVFEWARAFDRYGQSDDLQVPAPLVQRAHESYRKLANSSSQTMLLHGDLHHYNVLFDEARGWIAVDPKGVVGELEYEVGAIIRNPVELPDWFISATIIERRLRILTEALRLDYRRALEWSFAQAVLSAIWGVEDGYPVEPEDRFLKLASTIEAMLG